MKRVPKILAALVVLCSASAVTAQTFNQEVNRYRASRFDCEQAFRQRLERPANGCIGQCRTMAEATRDRCLDRAERRYQDVLRRALRVRR